MAPNAGNFWESLDGFGLFLYIHSIIFVVNYKMNIISSHKMFIILPSVMCAAVRGWFWVSGCSSDMSRCIYWYWYWYPGDCLRSFATLEAILRPTSVAELRLRPRITGNCDYRLGQECCPISDSESLDRVLSDVPADSDGCPGTRWIGGSGEN